MYFANEASALAHWASSIRSRLPLKAVVAAALVLPCWVNFVTFERCENFWALAVMPVASSTNAVNTTRGKVRLIRFNLVTLGFIVLIPRFFCLTFLVAP